MATTNVNLEDSITKAVADEGTNLQQIDQTQEITIPPQTKEADGTADGAEITDENTVDEFGLTAADQVQARQLFAGLKNPATASLIVQGLANQAGYVKPPETKTEVKQQAKDIQELIKEKLGPELAFLSEKLGPVLKEILESQQPNTAETQAVTQRLNNIEVQELNRQTQQALVTLGGEYNFKDNKIPDQVITKMNSLMNEILPTATMTPERYLRTVLHTACGEMGITLVKKQTQQRISTAKNNAPSQLRSARSGGEPQIIPGSQKLSLTESITKAIEEANKK